MSRRPTVAEIARVMEIAGDMYWRQRFGLMQTANVVIVRSKEPASTSRPAADGHSGGSPNRRVASGDSFAAETHPAPNTVRRHAPPVVAPDGHSTDNAAPRGTSLEVTKCWQ